MRFLKITSMLLLLLYWRFPRRRVFNAVIVKISATSFYIFMHFAAFCARVVNVVLHAVEWSKTRRRRRRKKRFKMRPIGGPVFDFLRRPIRGARLRFITSRAFSGTGLFATASFVCLLMCPSVFFTSVFISDRAEYLLLQSTIFVFFFCAFIAAFFSYPKKCSRPSFCFE